MADVILPFAETSNRRAFHSISDTKDQRLISALVTPYKNGMYVEKRPGVAKDENAIAAGLSGQFAFLSPSTGQKVYVFGDSSASDVYLDGVLAATDIGIVSNIIETIIGSTTYYLISVLTGIVKEGWFLADDAADDTSYTGTRTNASPIITSMDNTTGMYIGQKVSGTGIPADTRILTVDSSTQITMTANATSSGAGMTITKEPIAKIIDADFPVGLTTFARGHFVTLDGYVFILTKDGKIYNSDLNSVTSWSATNFISTNMSTDNGVSLAKYKNYIIAFGEESMEVFYNAGNPTGSPLARYNEAYSNIGITWDGAAILGLGAPPLTQYGDFICWQGGSPVPVTLVQHSSIYLLNDLRPQKISTPYIDRAITGRPVSLDILKFEGLMYLHVAVGTRSSLVKSWLYCFDTQMWMESGFPYYLRFSPGGLHCVAINDTGGHTYVWGDYAADTILWRDVTSTSYTMTIQMDKWDAGTNKRKFLDRIDLLGSDIQSSGTTTLEISIDDYATWVTVGTFDNTVIDPYMVNCGSFVGAAAFRITHSANTAWRAKGLKVYYRTENSPEEDM